MIRFSCDGCGAAFKVDDSKAGKTGKCPKCGAPIAIPPVESDLNSLEALIDPSVVPALPADTPAVASMPMAGGLMCPSCDQILAANAAICVGCGIKIPSGRPVMTAFEADLDELDIQAEGIVRWLSWLLPTGLHPIATEGGGGKRPIVAWLIVLTTILTSVLFWVVPANTDRERTSHRNLMLFDNDAMTGREMAIQNLIDDGVTSPEYFDERPTAGEFIAGEERTELDKGVDEYILAVSTQFSGQFRPSQLVTHAFLHGGLMHLAGNMLFLIVFGTRVNSLIGNIPTLVLYPVLAVLAAWGHMASVSGGPPIPMLGASGAIMGLCGMYLILFPLQKVYMVFWLRLGLLTGFRLLMKIFAIPGFLAVGAYVAFDVFYVAANLESGTAHWAHIGGFLAGVGAAVAVLALRIAPPGANLLSVILGKHAWAIIGRPARAR